MSYITVLEVRYADEEIKRLATLEEHPLDYAELFLRNAVFYGTKLTKKKDRAILCDAREAAVAVDSHFQTFRQGVIEAKEPVILDPQKHVVAEVSPPLWFDKFLTISGHEKLFPLASEISSVALEAFIDADWLKGNELGHRLCLNLQVADESRLTGEPIRDNEHEIAFLAEAEKFIKGRLKSRINSSILNCREFDDALHDALERLWGELFKYGATEVSTLSRDEQDSERTKKLPTDYPLGSKIHYFQKRIENYLKTVANTAAKKYLRNAKSQMRMINEVANLSIDDERNPSGLDNRGPFHYLFVKQGKFEIEKILSKKLLKSLYMRTEFGASFEEIAQEFGVSKAAVFKDFQKIRKQVGSVAVQSFAGFQTVDEYLLLANSRRPRRKVI